MRGIFFWGYGAVISLHSGCNGDQKFQSVMNEPSGERISIRYVSGAKAVKLKNEKNGALVDIQMSDSMPRVNDQKIGVHAKSFDFGTWIKNPQGDWIDLWASSKNPAGEAGKCSDTSHTIPLAASTEEGQSNQATFRQEADGTMELKLHAASMPDTVFTQFRIAPPAGKVDCVAGWKPDDVLAASANTLAGLRDLYLRTLAAQAGFDSSQMGKKLKRVSADTKSQSAEASAFSATKYSRTDGKSGPSNAITNDINS